MTDQPWLIALARLSDSFAASVAELLRELRAGVVAWAPEDDDNPVVRDFVACCLEHR